MRRKETAISRVVTMAVIIIIIVIAAGVGVYALTAKSSTSTVVPSTTITTSIVPTTVTVTAPGSSASSSPSQTTAISAAATSTNPNTLVYDYVNTPTSMDPGEWTDGGSNFIQQQIYETLFSTLPGNTSLVPWLAQNYTISSNGTTVVVNLRQGINFQDGTPFNASAVVFNVDRAVLMDSSTTTDEGLFGAAPGLINGSYYFSHTFGIGSSSYNQSAVNAFINSNGVVVGSNPYQVIFNLGYPSAAFISDLALPGMAIMSPSYVIANWTPPTDGHGYITGITAGEANPWMSNHTMGTGPFELKSWDQTTEDIVLTNNPNYWGSVENTGPSNFTTVELNYVQSDSARVLDLESGAADIADIPPSDYFAFINKNAWLSNGTIQITTPGVSVDGPYPENSITWIGFNFVQHNSGGSVDSFQPEANIDFRIAMADAVNITDIVDNAAFGFGTPANELLPPTTIGHNSSIPTYWNYNLTDSQGNLTEAASSLGFNSSHPQTISISYTIGDAVGQAVAEEMATNINNMNLGITVQPTPLPTSLLISQLVGGTIQMYVLEYPNPISDPNQYLTAFGISQEAAFQGYNNTMVKNLVLEQSSQLNSTLRMQEISEINYLMNKDVFEVWLYYPSTLGQGGNGGVGQIFRSWVHGFQYDSGRANLYLYGLWKS